MIESGSKPFAGELQKTIKNPSDFLWDSLHYLLWFPLFPRGVWCIWPHGDS
jgi:hypothetical protein